MALDWIEAMMARGIFTPPTGWGGAPWAAQLQEGDRVQRNAYARKGDKVLVGTVIGHADLGLIGVRWDSGPEGVVYKVPPWWLEPEQN